MKNIAKLYNKHSIMLKHLIQNINKNVKKGDTIIDLGCGSGVYINLLANKVGNNGKVIGTDIDNSMIKFCQRKFKKKNVVIKKIPAESPSKIKIKADVIFSSLVLHFTNIQKSIFEVTRSLKSKGKLIFAVPLYRSGIEVFDNEESKKFKSKFVKNLKKELKENNVYVKILYWKIASLEKANLKILLEYFKIPWRSEKLLPIPFRKRYPILKAALENTFREFPNFQSNRYYLTGVARKI